MADKYLEDTAGDGNVKIADDVIAKIATVSANSVDGVTENVKDIRTGMADMFGVKSSPKNAKVSVGEMQAVIDMYIDVEYGKDIVKICNEVQEKVKEAVEMMTALEVIEVNVHVVGISVPEDGRPSE